MNVGNKSFTYPISYPNAVLSVQGITHSNGNRDDAWYPYLNMSATNNSSAYIYGDYSDTDRTWLIVGY